MGNKKQSLERKVSTVEREPLKCIVRACAKGLRTSSGGERGFYGHKRLDGKGFV
jgi:hypothetical protein